MTGRDRLRALLSRLAGRPGAVKTGFDGPRPPRLLLVKRAADDDQKRPFTVLVVLDGTLRDGDGGGPLPAAVRWLRLFRDRGARIVVSSAGGPGPARSWLERYDVPYDDVVGPDDAAEADALWDDCLCGPDDGPDEALRLAFGDDRRPSPLAVVLRRTVVTVSGPTLLAGLASADDAGGEAEGDADDAGEDRRQRGRPGRSSDGGRS